MDIRAQVREGAAAATPEDLTMSDNCQHILTTRDDSSCSFYEAAGLYLVLYTGHVGHNLTEARFDEDRSDFMLYILYETMIQQFHDYYHTNQANLRPTRVGRRWFTCTVRGALILFCTDG